MRIRITAAASVERDQNSGSGDILGSSRIGLRHGVDHDGHGIRVIGHSVRHRELENVRARGGGRERGRGHGCGRQCNHGAAGLGPCVHERVQVGVAAAPAAERDQDAGVDQEPVRPCSGRGRQVHNFMVSSALGCIARGVHGYGGQELARRCVAVRCHEFAPGHNRRAQKLVSLSSAVRDNRGRRSVGDLVNIDSCAVDARAAHCVHARRCGDVRRVGRHILNHGRGQGIVARGVVIDCNACVCENFIADNPVVVGAIAYIDTVAAVIGDGVAFAHGCGPDDGSIGAVENLDAVGQIGLARGRARRAGSVAADDIALENIGRGGRAVQDNGCGRVIDHVVVLNRIVGCAPADQNRPHASNCDQSVVAGRAELHVRDDIVVRGSARAVAVGRVRGNRNFRRGLHGLVQHGEALEHIARRTQGEAIVRKYHFAVPGIRGHVERNASGVRMRRCIRVDISGAVCGNGIGLVKTHFPIGSRGISLLHPFGERAHAV